MPQLVPPLTLSRRALAAIVIGGSAGGIEALRQLIPALPPDLAVPVFVVLHLGPDSRGQWSAVFPHSAVAVREAEDKELAAPGTVYIAPPDYHLLVDETGCMSLSIDEPVNLSRPAIDVLFESAAWAYGARLLGIVLSGANADGAKGLAAVRRAGGQCWVQAPESAAATAMPRAALGAVPDAQVLSLKQMAAALAACRI
jgi:two-component system chemotaxis response regulator CheB